MDNCKDTPNVEFSLFVEGLCPKHEEELYNLLMGVVDEAVDRWSKAHGLVVGPTTEQIGGETYIVQPAKWTDQ